MHGKQKEYDKAIAVFSKAVRLDPNSAWAYSGLGVAHLENGKPDEAIAAYNEAIRLKPDYGWAYAGLGNARQQKGQLEEAIAAYRESIQLDPDSAWAYDRLARLLANSPEEPLRNPTEALKLANQLVELSPTTSSYWNTKGMALYRTADYHAALKALGNAIELEGEGGNSYSFFWLAMTHGQLGDKDQARTWYDKGVQWMEKNKQTPMTAEEVRRYRAEAAELLGIDDAKKGQEPPVKKK